MAIEVLCPNGHKIICPEDRAGRSARCPRCSEPFRIPEPTGNGQSPAAEPAESPPGHLDGHDPLSASDSKADPASDVKTGAAAAAPNAGGPASDMALAVSASAEDVDVTNSAEVLADWSGLSDLRLIDSDIIAKNDRSTTTEAPATADEVDQPAQQPAAPDRPADDDMILFLCPSGHKLHGLKRLAGKVGQCPHCDVKFEIPFPYDIDDDEQGRDGLDDTVTEDPLSDFSDGAPDEATGGQQPVFEEPPPERPRESDTPSKRGLLGAVRATGSSIIGRLTGRSGKRKAQSEPVQAPAPVPAPPSPEAPASRSKLERAAHPLADLVTRLWSERDHGGVIELHLRRGALFAPDWFDAHHSQGTHGLFASQAADGTVAMTIVPWDEVTRVVVRGVVGLPDGMFE